MIVQSVPMIGVPCQNNSGNICAFIAPHDLAIIVIVGVTVAVRAVVLIATVSVAVAIMAVAVGIVVFTKPNPRNDEQPIQLIVVNTITEGATNVDTDVVPWGLAQHYVLMCCRESCTTKRSLLSSLQKKVCQQNAILGTTGLGLLFLGHDIWDAKEWHATKATIS